MDIPSFVVIPAPSKRNGREDQDDTDSVITFTEDDLCRWEQMVVTNPASSVSCLPKYPRRSRSSPRNDRGKAAPNSSPTMPKRKISLVFSNQMLQEIEDPPPADTQPRTAMCCLSEDALGGESSQPEPKSSPVVEAMGQSAGRDSTKPIRAQTEQGKQRASCKLSSFHHQSAFVFEDSVFKFIDVLSVNDLSTVTAALSTSDRLSSTGSCEEDSAQSSVDDYIPKVSIEDVRPSTNETYCPHRRLSDQVPPKQPLRKASRDQGQPQSAKTTHLLLKPRPGATIPFSAYLKAQMNNM